MRRVLCCLLVLLLAAPSAMAAVAAEALVAPFQLVNGAAVILVTVNGKQVPALVDTGAQVSALDRIYANGHGLLPTAGLNGNINGQEANLSLDHDVFLGKQRLAYNVILTNLGALPSGVPMILGDDALRQFVVEFDFDAMRITLHPQRGFTAPPNAEQLPMKLNTRRLPSVAMSIEGSAPVQALLDSGFNAPVGLSQATANKLKLGDRQGVTVNGRGINTSGAANRITLGKVQLGATDLVNVPALVFDRNLPEIGTQPAIVGLPVLQRFHVWMDIDHEKLWLAPRVQATPPAATPNGACRSGPCAIVPGSAVSAANTQLLAELTSRAASLGLRVEILAQFIHIVDVAPGSRAERAGLTAGEDIWVINNQVARAFFASHTDFSGPLTITLRDGTTVRTIPPAASQ